MMNLSVYAKGTNIVKRQTEGKGERYVDGKTNECKKENM
jgi:hypothetical protein